MTEEEKDTLRRAKSAVSEFLAQVRIGDYRFCAVDPRLDSYVREVARNPVGHNLFEQLAVKRFLHMADRYGINATEVIRFFTLYENLHFPGKKGQQKYLLTPVQTFSLPAYTDSGMRGKG